MNTYKVKSEYEAFVKAHNKDEAIENWLGEEWGEDNTELLQKFLGNMIAIEDEEIGLTDEQKKKIREFGKGL